MSATILKPCRVPWSISPTVSCLTLRHEEADSAPECSVVFGAGRLRDDDLTDSRRVELVFEECYYSRLRAVHVRLAHDLDLRFARR